MSSVATEVSDGLLTFRLSAHVRTISEPRDGRSFVFHSLYGRPLILNAEALNLLHLFRAPRSLQDAAAECDGDPMELLNVFAEHRYIVPVDADERAPLVASKRAHMQAVAREETVDRMGLAISDLCNFGCGHCIHFQPSTNAGATLPLYAGTPAQLHMTTETAIRCIEQYVSILRRYGQPTGKIHFGNAEPLTNWPVIADVLAYCDGLAPLTFEFSINTNLSLLSREMALVMKRHNVAIATSLDGTERANDAIRVTRGGQGTYDAIIAKFDLLADIDYPLDGFSITVTKDNFDLVDTDVLDIAAARGMTSIAFDYDLISLAGVPVKQRVEKLLRMKRYANARGMDFFGTWDSPFRNITSASLLDGAHAFCAAVQGKSLQFNVDGSLKVCGHTTTRVGDSRSLQDAFAPGGGLYDLVAARFPGTDAYCGGCEIEGPCGGQCHVTREVVARATGSERERLFGDMCDFYRATTEALALDYMQSGDDVLPANNSSGGCNGH
jgi:radical SAM protein with 4Fe4S-binding SPASM domain